jgi:hypothetical protein
MIISLADKATKYTLTGIGIIPITYLLDSRCLDDHFISVLINTGAASVLTASVN